MQKKLPSEPSLLGSAEAVHAFPGGGDDGGGGGDGGCGGSGGGDGGGGGAGGGAGGGDGGGGGGRGGGGGGGGGGGLYTCLYAWLQPVACGLHSAYSLHIVACSQ